MKRVPQIVVSKLLINEAAKLEDGVKYRFGSRQCNGVEQLRDCRRTKRSRNTLQRSRNKVGAQGFLLPAAFHCIHPLPDTSR